MYHTTNGDNHLVYSFYAGMNPTRDLQSKIPYHVNCKCTYLSNETISIVDSTQKLIEIENFVVAHCLGHDFPTA